MHFGMFQAGGKLSRQTGCEVLMQIGITGALGLQCWRCIREHAFTNASQHYYAKHFALMLAMFAKLFVQCTVAYLSNKLLLIFITDQTYLSFLTTVLKSL